MHLKPMTLSSTVLVVDDDPSVQAALLRTLDHAGYDVLQAETGAQALAAVSRKPIDLVLLDLHLPDVDGLVLLQNIRAADAGPPVLMISGAGSIDSAVQAIRHGALDFLQKPLIPERVVVSVQNALRYQRLAQEHAQLGGAPGFRTLLLGDSPIMAALNELIRRAARSEGRVLIRGEHGTGKELVARALHQQSRRGSGPFITVNCAAVPRELIESELFGHTRGAFTGATTARRGRFELADGGTLFLDEIGEMPLDMQSKLLRVLQESCFERVGSGDSVTVDVRVIAATNRDLARAIEAGGFREDLFYRLNVVQIEVPPLRDRLEDIPLLARTFLATSARKNHRNVPELTADAEHVLQQYDYPGNVRELQNLMERLVILVDAMSIGAEDIQRALPLGGRVPAEAPTAFSAPTNGSYREQLEAAERRILSSALAQFRGNVAEAARALQLERSHLYKKCRALGMPLAREAAVATPPAPSPDEPGAPPRPSRATHSRKP